MLNNAEQTDSHKSLTQYTGGVFSLMKFATSLLTLLAGEKLKINDMLQGLLYCNQFAKTEIGHPNNCYMYIKQSLTFSVLVLHPTKLFKFNSSV